MRDWSSWETFGLRGPKPEVDLAATLANAERVAQHAYERLGCGARAGVLYGVIATIVSLVVFRTRDIVS